MADLSSVTELDFQQPNALWTKVFDDGARERYVDNVSGHLGGVKKAEIKEKVLAIFGAIDPDLGARIAKKIGHPVVAPFKVSLRVCCGCAGAFADPPLRYLRRPLPPVRLVFTARASRRAVHRLGQGL